MRYLNTALYIASIVAVNWAFIVVPPLPIPGGAVWPPVSRDYAQREIGHYILVAMGVGVVLSYFMASPAVAMASATAFLISELVDWAVFSFTGRRFSQRILLSSLVATPVDSAVFLAMVGFFSWVGVLAMTGSKLVGAVIVWWLVRRRERLSAA